MFALRYNRRAAQTYDVGDQFFERREKCSRKKHGPGAIAFETERKPDPCFGSECVLRVKQAKHILRGRPSDSETEEKSRADIRLPLSLCT